MIVIADTSPINYLVWIGEIDVLPKIYGRILIPPAVFQELRAAGAPDAVRQWIAQPPDWLEVRIPTHQPDAQLAAADLDEGERDAILLPQELGADEIIIDEMLGQREAERRHLHFTGTLGVLRTAGPRGLLNFKSAVAALRRTTFHVSEDLLDRLIAQQED
jgi:predicted nucleic acid-binding protein